MSNHLSQSSTKPPKPPASIAEKPSIDSRRPRQSKSVLGGVLLLTGSFFLLNTLTGYRFIRFWPILLIAAGVIFIWKGIDREA